MLSVLGNNFSRQQLGIFFLFFLENRLQHFMQIVSSGDNLHEMSKSIFWEKKEKILQNAICLIPKLT